jgi:hypothetical protein
MPVRRSRHILRQLELELAVHVESAGAAVPVDAVVVHAGEGPRGRVAGFVCAGGFGHDCLVRVPEGAGEAAVDVRLGLRGGQPFDVGFLVVGGVEEDSWVFVLVELDALE